MKTRPRNCSGGSRSFIFTLFKFSVVVFWPLYGGGLAWGQNQVAQPSAATAKAQDQEATYQTALKNGQEAQKEHFFLTALMYYQQALKVKSGDEVATKLQSDMRAEINARLSGAKSPGVATAPPGGAPPVSAPNQNVVTTAPPGGAPPESAPNQNIVSPAAPEQSAEAPRPPPVRRNEISVSGDYFLGQGNVTMPFGFSLGQALGGQNIQPTVAKPNRTADYYGATLSYSYGQTWYLDLTYAHGSSSGNVDVQLGGPGEALPSAFSIKDDWYQAFIRYTFPGLRGKRLWAYVRGGVSYVQAELTDTTVIPALGLYAQTDNTDDLLGNVGFGVGYRLYTSRHVRLGLQVEGEGFYGQRTQKSLETLPEDFGVKFSTATINNDLYGGIGRATVHFEYRFGESQAFRVFADGGVQGTYTFVNYPSGLGTFDELLWGPYVKVGVLFSF